MTRFTKSLALSMLCLLPFAVYGQSITVTHKVSTEQPELYAVPGSHLLEQENRKVREYLALHPEALVRSSLQKATAWNFAVGDTRTWKSQNIKTSVFFDVPSTCRAVGTHCYMFVEDAVWGSRVTQDAVNAVMDAFDNQTPANPTKGVYQMDVETFGAPPDVDNDPKIVILILDIQDGNTGSGPFVAGYFWGGQRSPQLSEWQQRGDLLCGCEPAESEHAFRCDAGDEHGSARISAYDPFRQRLPGGDICQ